MRGPRCSRRSSPCAWRQRRRRGRRRRCRPHGRDGGGAAHRPASSLRPGCAAEAAGSGSGGAAAATAPPHSGHARGATSARPSRGGSRWAFEVEHASRPLRGVWPARLADDCVNATRGCPTAGLRARRRSGTQSTRVGSRSTSACASGRHAPVRSRSRATRVADPEGPPLTPAQLDLGGYLPLPRDRDRVREDLARPRQLEAWRKRAPLLPIWTAGPLDRRALSSTSRRAAGWRGGDARATLSRPADRAGLVDDLVASGLPRAVTAAGKPTGPPGLLLLGVMPRIGSSPWLTETAIRPPRLKSAHPRAPCSRSRCSYTGSGGDSRPGRRLARAEAARRGRS
jgi:hypothetical protein